MNAETNKSIKDKALALFKKISFYAALLLFGAAAMAFYFESKPAKQDIKYYKAGEVSVSINEKGELTFITRNSGKPLVVDSTLTEVINNMLAAREYVKVNTLR